MPTQNVILSIARARSEDVTDVHAFHISQATEFIWPRTHNELDQLADKGSLLVARANDVTLQNEYIVGMCYVMKGEEPEGERRWEFGGICVSNEFRGYGIGSTLGILAISSHYLYEPPQKAERLIAHVHHNNSLPRNMLEAQLGFILVGQEAPPLEVVPLGLQRNANGKVVGDLYEFRILTLDKFADWLETFDNRIEGTRGYLTTNLNLQFFQAGRTAAIQALRELASSSQAY
jgi:ribosomal protein S18 acetylase RimI-like enzyme